jgi:hypothetical protein
MQMKLSEAISKNTMSGVQAPRQLFHLRHCEGEPGMNATTS